MSPPRIEVVAGVLHHPDDDGRVLLTQRPMHKARGGLWEFPGGKIEAGEHPLQALSRELKEELDVELGSAQPLFRLEHAYPDLIVRLHVWRCSRWCGGPLPLDAEALSWQSLRAPSGDWPQLSEADCQIRRWLELPLYLTISPDCLPGAEAQWLAAALRPQLPGWLLVRTPSLLQAPLRELCRAVLRARPDLQSRLLLSADLELAAELKVGVHLKSAQLHEPLSQPVTPRWLGASCHNAAELARAAELGCDYATLGPVLATASHPGAPPLGWDRFQQLVAGANLPVYALGGQDPNAFDRAQRVGALGVAGIRAFWPTISAS